MACVCTCQCQQNNGYVDPPDPQEQPAAFPAPEINLSPIVPQPIKHYDEETIRYSEFAKAAYDLSATKLDSNYELIQKFSNDDRSVWLKKDGSEIIMSFRGTDPGESSRAWRDMGSDLAIALGYESVNHRFQTSLRVTKALVAEYGPDRIVLTGHSLGGSQALYVSRELNLRAVVFNPGLSPASSLIRGAPFSRAEIWANPLDPISNLSFYVPGAKVHYIAHDAPKKWLTEGVIYGSGAAHNVTQWID